MTGSRRAMRVMAVAGVALAVIFAATLGS